MQAKRDEYYPGLDQMSQYPPHVELRKDPVYQNSLRTGSVMALIPPGSFGNKRNSHLFPDIRMQQVAHRMDHLIRNAIHPGLGGMSYRHVSALIGFLEVIERDLPTMRLSQVTTDMLNSRIAYARRLVQQLRDDCELWKLSPPSSEMFRVEIETTTGSDIGSNPHRYTIEEVIYSNPIAPFYGDNYFPPIYWRLSQYWPDNYYV